ncbi:NRDE family protein [Polyangium aurulentum]|uniref:NRDE family protein n=1 Tax=Polyangium aurulentum TaxID=2567896 RepID=UPI0010AEE8E3|nr:NRDE family protein [Polyangium aurulentum]UQA62181.1 NRDE family protein [Polyangium aurulentum]
MCTLLVALKAWSEWPLVIAANRDEKLDRPSRGPFLWDERPRMVAPRDELAGGSWLGLNAKGLFVGITNRAGVAVEANRRSRGALVIEALGAESARALHARLSSMDPRAHNAFHLFYADRGGAFLTVSDGEALTQSELFPGVHVITERSAPPLVSPRARRVLDGWERSIVRQSAPDPEAIAAILGDHDGQPEAPCVHVPDWNYGTRSAAILLLSDELPRSRFFWAEGPPCRTPFEDRSDLLANL